MNVPRGRFKTNPKRQRGRPSLALRVSFETASSNPNALHVASFTERLARERQGTKLGVVFNVITAVGLGAIMAQALLDMMQHRQQSRGQSWER